MQRRSFLKFLASAAGIAAISKLGFSKKAYAAAPVPLDEKDPMANSLGYKCKSEAVDSKKFPKFNTDKKANAKCDNCQFYTRIDDKTGACTIFPGKSVCNTGWCNSWVKKA